MNLLRNILIVLIVFVAVVLSARWTPHHAAKDPFQGLYRHLVPEKLVQPGEHATDDHASGHAPANATAYVASITLPDSLEPLDMDGELEGTQLIATNLQLFQIAAVLLIAVCCMGVPRYFRTGQGDRFTRVLAGTVLWIRDSMVYPTMGKKTGRKFLPYFGAIFFLILFMNLIGLVPGAATATASIFVTGAFAVTILVTMLVCGMVVQGPIAFWKNLVPHVPLALWPLMAVVELAGLFIKPFALMVRLFANMSGGHMVVLSFMGLIFYFGARNTFAGWGAAPVAVGFAVFIMIIEAFVAMLQAFVFTQLSILFVQASIHPEH